MLKWIGRILYFIFVFFIVTYIEGGNGGVDGFRRGSYIDEYVMPVLTQETYETTDIHESLAHFSAVLDFYYSTNQLGGSAYDSTDADINDEFKIRFSLHPILRPGFENGDGFIIIFEEVSDEVAYYTIEFEAINNDAPEGDRVVMKNDDDGLSYFTIFTDSQMFYTNRQVTRTLSIYNTFFSDARFDTNEDVEKVDYTLLSILINAHIEVDDEIVVTPIYRLHKEGETFGGNPQVTDNSLDLSTSDYAYSDHLAGSRPTEAEATQWNIVTLYRPVDLSPYNGWYWGIYGVYFIIIVVIPYFWFFHKRVMRAIRARKDLNEKENIAQKKLRPGQVETTDQIFSDVEPSEDD